MQKEQCEAGGVTRGAEGPDAAGFLRVNLSKWIPSLRGRDIEIDRAHRVYDGGRGSDRLRTLIFHVLRWHNRSDILKGARQAYQVQVQVELYCHSATCGDIQWNEMSCLTGPRCYINTDINTDIQQ